MLGWYIHVQNTQVTGNANVSNVMSNQKHCAPTQKDIQWNVKINSSNWINTNVIEKEKKLVPTGPGHTSDQTFS